MDTQNDEDLSGFKPAEPQAPLYPQLYENQTQAPPPLWLSSGALATPALFVSFAIDPLTQSININSPLLQILQSFTRFASFRLPISLLQTELYPGLDDVGFFLLAWVGVHLWLKAGNSRQFRH